MECRACALQTCFTRLSEQQVLCGNSSPSMGGAVMYAIGQLSIACGGDAAKGTKCETVDAPEDAVKADDKYGTFHCTREV